MNNPVQPFSPTQITTLDIASRECIVYADERPEVLIVQPLDVSERAAFRHEAEAVRLSVGVPVAMVAVIINDWMSELAPWADPHLPKGKSADCRGEATLRYVVSGLMPAMRARYGSLPSVLGGYSLAGLFSLWAATVVDAFEGVAAASPSVWVEGWDEYSREHKTNAKAVYLSLGDREEHVRNPWFARVGDNIRAEQLRLQSYLGSENCVLEGNRGNHFNNIPQRVARAFAWCACRLSGAAPSAIPCMAATPSSFRQPGCPKDNKE